MPTPTGRTTSEDLLAALERALADVIETDADFDVAAGFKAVAALATSELEAENATAHREMVERHTECNKPMTGPTSAPGYN